ncbi:TonB-dependent receptor [Flagellimonas pelagia]|nr:TonB-dependent receptor [Muricauda sp. D6]MAO15633.1 SusC/RagA family TonB-linked outer membrane protein [Allomuricauda sp.]RIV45454.1 SusC/RagA family TonB-linked outer membrane protein [Allomuricauda maritima]RUA17273.1 MAG: SusC/RagA family TonB-linked outer membrane protein [Flavobacteriia bacterium]TXJ96932.1 TonB-dependent receptor [Allomuricauda maritima]|tara:strand:+ start:1063 stop:4533 length:3471 start_codon:yes stop_codon:yes gene_type:complete
MLAHLPVKCITEVITKLNSKIMNNYLSIAHVLGKLNGQSISIKIMRSFLCYILLGLTALYANHSYSQTKFNLDLKNVSLETLFNQLQDESEYIFFYKDGILPNDNSITLKKNNITLPNVLDSLLESYGLGYNIIGRQVTVFKDQTYHIPNTDAVFFQDFTVSGTVLDDSGVPLAGANIIEKGTTNGTQTDFDGNFSIKVTDGDVILTVSYIGFTTKEIPVNGQSVLNIVLQESTAVLDEIVVVGYGTQKKSDLTGSVASLGQDDMNPGANVSVDQMMLGRAAGVQINQASSAPGGGLAIRIRGSNSLNASNEPLYVIDGFPIDNSPNLGSGGVAEVGQNLSPRNPLNSLNPADVESIEILKDASATAIYGSRGANGVILITTKKGSKGKVNVTYDVYAGIQSVAEKIDVLSTSQYIDAINDLSIAQGNAVVFNNEDISRIGRGTDWQDEVFRSAPLTNHNLAVSGGSENTNYYASFNYFDQEGVVKNTGIKRYTGRINLETKIGNKTQIGLNFNTSLVKDNNNVDGVNTNEQAGPIYSSLLYDPTETIFNDDGTFSQSANLTVNNPVTLINAIISESETNRTFGSAFLNYDFTEDLSGKFNFGTDRQTSRRDIYNTTQTIRGGAAGGIANINVLERSNYLFEYTMTYDKAFNEDHALTVLGGITFQKFSSRFFSGNISGFPTDDIKTNNLALGDTNTDVLSSGKEENTLLSYLGRVNYNLFDKFLFTASIRADGSSRFGENNKWGYFPSFALGYKLDQEEFIPDSFSQFKLRASWGQTGNQEIGNYASQLTFGTGPNVVFGGTISGSVSPQRIPNPDLKWETTEQLNIGLDFGISGGRFSGSLDYFSKESKDLLFDLPLPFASGYSSILTNVGEVKNSGVEFLFNSTNIVTDDFKWDTSLNFSAIKNEVVDLGRIESIVTGSVQAVGNTAIIQEGDPLASYYGYVVTGIFQEGDDIANSPQPTAQPGFPIFEDRNGDGAITPTDQTIIGTPYPDFTYGIQNSISYKNLTLDFFFQGQAGVDLLNINLIESLYPANFRRNRLAHQILDRWTPQNTGAKWPSGVNPNAYGAGKVNTLTIQDASYLRLKNVRLSYNVPVQNIDFLNSLQVYVTGQNLFTITDYVGFDPEANSFGRSNVRIDYSSYPLATTYMLGLTANF